MKITKIEKQRKANDRYSIYFDQEFVCGIDEEILIEFGLYKDLEITADLLEEIRAAENDHKLYSSALNYLSFGLRTIKEMRDYLHKQNEKKDDHASEEVINQTIEKLKQLGYLNDSDYAKSYVRTKYSLSHKGPTVIAQELRLKGVDDHSIVDALDEYPIEEQVNNVQLLTEKFIKTKNNLPPKMLISKLYNFLITKGFDKELVNDLMADLTIQEDDDQLIELLEKEAQIYLKRHKRKHSGYNLKQKISQSLYGKGFDYELIKNWLENNEDLFD